MEQDTSLSLPNLACVNNVSKEELWLGDCATLYLRAQIYFQSPCSPSGYVLGDLIGSKTFLTFNFLTDKLRRIIMPYYFEI